MTKPQNEMQNEMQNVWCPRKVLVFIREFVHVLPKGEYE